MPSNIFIKFISNFSADHFSSLEFSFDLSIFPRRYVVLMDDHLSFSFENNYTNKSYFDDESKTWNVVHITENGADNTHTRTHRDTHAHQYLVGGVGGQPTPLPPPPSLD